MEISDRVDWLGQRMGRGKSERCRNAAFCERAERGFQG
jgi:hypothetical protein